MASASTPISARRRQWPARFDRVAVGRGLALPQDTSRRAAALAKRWAPGIEGQRKADLGNGTFLNPIMAGDHPDPSILKDGDDYYMTFSSFDAYPGLVIWHSRDLVNWQPIGPTLFKNVGSVWAPDLVKHKGRYYIYFPGISPNRSNYVIWADNIRGPWSEPIDLKLTRIDPGHAVGPDGKRYLFLSAGELVPLADDGLSTTWARRRRSTTAGSIPPTGSSRRFAQEGPKILQRGDYYYMVLAEGGTAGPPTGHMIVAARSKTIEGPWENSPYNPILRTQSSDERWWSKGHGTLVEDRAGKWWMVYHAYENGYLHARPADAARADRVDRRWLVPHGRRRSGRADRASRQGERGPHGFAFSDDFSTPRMGVQWSFYAGDEADRDRYRYENGALVLKGKGTGPADSSPLWFVNGDHAYEMEVEIDADPRRERRACWCSTAASSTRASASRRRTCACISTAWIARQRSRRISASACGSACATIATSSRSTTAPTARRGSATIARSKCRAITTTSPTIS